VGDRDSVQEMVRRAEVAFGGVDVLFTNAAEVPLINQQDACATDLPEEVFDRIHRVILRGVFLCAKYAGQSMIRRGGGSMIFTATVDAQVGCAGLDAYTAAKGGVLALTRSLAAGLARHGIRVNAISPGFVATEPQRVFMDNPRSRAEIEALHLFPVPSPEEVVPLALFLASDEAGAITGSIYPVDAGYTAFKCSHVDVKDAMNRL
jgi:NAD(P)-dependent dehydrogenase (short-subunit alcohol dehydrogenase family)